MDFRELSKRASARIYGSRLGNTARWGTTEKRGAFFSKPRELEVNGQAILSAGLSFDMTYDDDVAQLDPDDLITIDGEGTFRFLRELQPGGDDSGNTTLVLGKP